MLDSGEIEKRLKGVDRQLIVAFAARCSLRVLPFLVENKKKESFWYWTQKERSKHLLAIFIAQKVAVNCSVDGRVRGTAARLRRRRQL